MTPPAPETWPQDWRDIADAIRLAAQTGTPINSARALVHASGISNADIPSVQVVERMMRAGALIRHRTGNIYQFGLPDGTTTPLPATSAAAEMQAVVAAVERAAEMGREVRDYAALAKLAKLRGEAGMNRCAKAQEAGLIRRETRVTPEGHQQVSYVVPASGQRTPWTMLPLAPKRADAPPPKMAHGDGMRTQRDVAFAVMKHKARMARAKPQTEAEMKAAVDAYIARHGVTRIMPPPDPGFGTPVASRIGSISSAGQVTRRGRS